MKKFRLLDNRAEYALNYSILPYIENILRLIDSENFRGDFLKILEDLPSKYAFNLELYYEVNKKSFIPSIIVLNFINQLKKEIIRDICHYFNVNIVTSQNICEYSYIKHYLNNVPYEQMRLEYIFRGVLRRINLRDVKIEDLYALCLIDRNIKIFSSYGGELEKEKIIDYCNNYHYKYLLKTIDNKYYFNAFCFIDILKKLCKFVGIRRGGRGSIWCYVEYN